MAKGFNQVIIMGNLTRDPELRTTPSGQSVCSFGIATNRSWQNASGEAQEAVDFHNVVAWGKLAELVNQYLSKGRKCLVVGRLQNQTWEKDGEKRSRTEIVANDVTFLDGAGGGQTQSSQPQKQSNKNEEEVVIEDIDDKPVDLSDIPF